MPLASLIIHHFSAIHHLVFYQLKTILTEVNSFKQAAATFTIHIMLAPRTPDWYNILSESFEKLIVLPYFQKRILSQIPAKTPPYHKRAGIHLHILTDKC